MVCVPSPPFAPASLSHSFAPPRTASHRLAPLRIPCSLRSAQQDYNITHWSSSPDKASNHYEASAFACKDICDADPKCCAWTYCPPGAGAADPERCCLKGGVPSGVQGVAHWTGLARRAVTSPDNTTLTAQCTPHTPPPPPYPGPAFIAPKIHHSPDCLHEGGWHDVAGALTFKGTHHVWQGCPGRGGWSHAASADLGKRRVSCGCVVWCSLLQHVMLWCAVVRCGALWCAVVRCGRGVLNVMHVVCCVMIVLQPSTAFCSLFRRELKRSSFVIRHSTFIIHPYNFVLRHSSFILLPSPFALRLSSFLLLPCKSIGRIAASTSPRSMKRTKAWTPTTLPAPGSCRSTTTDKSARDSGNAGEFCDPQLNTTS